MLKDYVYKKPTIESDRLIIRPLRKEDKFKRMDIK